MILLSSESSQILATFFETIFRMSCRWVSLVWSASVDTSEEAYQDLSLHVLKQAHLKVYIKLINIKDSFNILVLILAHNPRLCRGSSKKWVLPRTVHSPYVNYFVLINTNLIGKYKI
jgi:hypothetical protein